MNLEDNPRFLQALASMAVIFCDEVTKPRQKLYWELFRDRVTIEEWEQACGQSMLDETFHKVPLPAVLMEYVTTARLHRRHASEVANPHMHPTPDQVLALREALVPAEEIKALLASVWPAPAPAFAAPLEKESVEDRKALLRQQLESLSPDNMAIEASFPRKD